MQNGRHQGLYRTHGAVAALFVALSLLVQLLMASFAFASTSSEMSDDGQDYGWLYRLGPYLYRIADTPGDNPPSYEYVQNEDMPLEKNGRWYASSTPRYHHLLYSTLYGDGTLFLHKDNAVDIDAVIASGEEGSPLTQGSSGFFNCNDYPRMICFRVYNNAGKMYQGDSVKKLHVDPSTEVFFHEEPDPDRDLYLDRSFEGFCNLEEVTGLEYLPSANALTVARMFAGCEKLTELDLSGFDTARCTDFGGMLDGCVSLETLSFGEGWTQAAARQTDDETKLVTFPIRMTCETPDGGVATYQAGDVIPDGAATYVTAALAPIRSASLVLTSSNGTTWEHDTASDMLVCEYTGEEVAPVASLFLDGEELEEGSDFVVSYEDNVEVGEATITVTGIGTCYGATTIPFRIVDTGAYAFLYDDGLLYLKAGHDVPSSSAVQSDLPPSRGMRLFDASTAEPGTGVAWADDADAVKCVVVDRSFSVFEPVSLAGWFAGCTQLSSVEGLASINGTAVLSMAEMFADCDSLEEIDLTGLDTSKVRDARGLARGCDKLARLRLGGAGFVSVTDSSEYVDGCPALAEIATAAGWRNASDESARLTLPKETYKTLPSYARVQAGAALASGAATYRLRDLALQFTKVEMTASSYTCTGAPIKPAMTVKLGNVVLRQGTDYTVSYADNVYPGKAKATIKGTGVFGGGLVVPFTIVARVTKVGDRLTVTNASGTYTLMVTKVSKNGRVAEATVLRAQASYGTSTMYLPSECTIGGVKVTVTAVSSKMAGSFANVSTVVIGAKVTKIGSRAFRRAYSVTTLVIKSKRLKRVRNCLADSNIYTVRTAVTLTRARQRKYKRWFTNSATVGKYVYYSYDFG